MLTRRPLIGITTYGRDERNHFTLPAEYVEAVDRAGGIPVLVAPGSRDVGELLSRLDGVILAGGGDLDPALYGGAPHETVYHVDRERDESELALAREVVASGKPTLGICRGTQLLNVVLGGTLHVHVPDVFGESVLHRLPPRAPTPHAVEVEADSRLAAILGATSFEAASWHHQALCDVAAGFRVVARAPDGVLEAVEIPDHAWCIAVQWHPELTARDDPTQQRLFDALVAACGERRGQ